MVDLTKFCNSKDPRLLCQKPYVFNGQTYATNGHVLVCMHGSLLEDDELGRRLLSDCERAEGWCKPELFVTGFVPLTVEIKGNHFIGCGDCCGTGKVRESTDCEHCENGEFHHDGYDYECQHCDGTGQDFDSKKKDSTDLVECKACRGLGKFYLPVKVDARSFSSRYLKLLLELPGIEYLPVNEYGFANNPQGMLFRFAGGVGMLMPMGG